ncbi:MAG TPA: hypothetical protein VJV03_16225 [Pyrinomonadaceae bacterium]|nr:hypothetical protein [Pyrinomonadaceae bacterium]
MGNWADDAFNRLKNKEGHEHDKRQVDALHRQQVMAEAPHLWNQLVNTIKMEVAAFSERRPGYLQVFQFDMMEGPSVSVKSPEREFELLFDEPTPRITCVVRSLMNPTSREVTGQGAFRFAVSGGKVWIHDESTQRGRVVDELATSLLNTLV